MVDRAFTDGVVHREGLARQKERPVDALGGLANVLHPIRRIGEALSEAGQLLGYPEGCRLLRCDTRGTRSDLHSDVTARLRVLHHREHRIRKFGVGHPVTRG